VVLSSIGLNLCAENIGKGTLLGNNIVEALHELKVPAQASIFILLQAPESRDLNRFLLQDSLLKSGFTVVETEQFEDYSDQIRVESFERSRTVIETSFLIQFMRITDSQVLAIKSFAFQEKYQEEAQVRNRWYSPFLTALAIGSLVILLFWG